MRPSSPLLDSVRDQFEDYDQLEKDFTRVFLNSEPSCLQNAQLFDVVFLVGQSKQKARLIGVRAILAVRSRVFQVSSPFHDSVRKVCKTFFFCFAIGNAIRYPKWIWFTTSTGCRIIITSSTHSNVTSVTISSTEKLKLSASTRYRNTKTKKCSIITNGEACILAPRHNNSRLGTLNTKTTKFRIECR